MFCVMQVKTIIWCLKAKFNVFRKVVGAAVNVAMKANREDLKLIYLDVLFFFKYAKIIWELLSREVFFLFFLNILPVLK